MEPISDSSFRILHTPSNDWKREKVYEKCVHVLNQNPGKGRCLQKKRITPPQSTGRRLSNIEEEESF